MNIGKSIIIGLAVLTALCGSAAAQTANDAEETAAAPAATTETSAPAATTETSAPTSNEAEATAEETAPADDSTVTLTEEPGKTFPLGFRVYFGILPRLGVGIGKFDDYAQQEEMTIDDADGNRIFNREISNGALLEAELADIGTVFKYDRWTVSLGYIFNSFAYRIDGRSAFFSGDAIFKVGLGYRPYELEVTYGWDFGQLIRGKFIYHLDILDLEPFESSVFFQYTDWSVDEDNRTAHSSNYLLGFEIGNKFPAWLLATVEAGLLIQTVEGSYTEPGYTGHIYDSFSTVNVGGWIGLRFRIAPGFEQGDEM